MLKAIIFDKDGTLIELGAAWDEPTIQIMTKLLNTSSLSDQERKDFAEFMGIKDGKILPNSIFAAGSLYDQSIEIEKVAPLTREEIELALEDAYLEYTLLPENTPILSPGIIGILDELKDDYILAVVTNDNRRITEAMLKKVGLDQYFSFVGCADDYQPKPNPGALFEFSKQFSVPLNDMVYIGDSTIDMEYGKLTRASIGFAATPEDKKYLQEADYIIEHFNDLPKVIDQVNRLEDK